MSKESVIVLISIVLTLISFFVNPWFGVAVITALCGTFVLAMLKDWI